MSNVKTIVSASRDLSRKLADLRFSDPVEYVYNPFEYARAAWEQYLTRYGSGRKRVIFLGMNPGPWGMVQNGIPFGERDAVAEWLRIDAPIISPDSTHPKRPVKGYGCPRSEVSGRRFWGLMRNRFGLPEVFFDSHFVANYCPLAFLEGSGRNRTPDKLPAAEAHALFAACDALLAEIVAVMRPEWLIGVGAFATNRARSVVAALEKETDRPYASTPHVATVLHPSPASPRANAGWDSAATRQLVELGVWHDGPTA